MSVTSSCPPTSTEVSRSPPAIRRIEAARVVIRRTSTRPTSSQPMSTRATMPTTLRVRRSTSPSWIADSESAAAAAARSRAAETIPSAAATSSVSRAPVAGEVLLLEAGEAKFVLAQAKRGVPLRAVSDKLREVRLEIRMFDVRPRPLEVSRHRIELLAKRAQEVRVGDLERLAEQALHEA